MDLPVLMSHNRMSLSSEPEAKTFESGLHAIAEIPARWPSSVWARAPEEASQILMVASAAVLSQYRILISPKRSILTAAGNPFPIR